MRSSKWVSFAGLCLAFALSGSLASATVAAGATAASSGAVAPSSVRVAVTEAKASLLPSGRLHIHLRTNARSVLIKYSLADQGTRKKVVRVRRGVAEATLPAGTRSVRVRGAATARKRASAWITIPVVSATSPDQAGNTAVAAWETELLGLVNQQRAAGYTCPDGMSMPPAGPLTRNPRLDAAARSQATWLAQSGKLSHDGPGGESLGTRLTSAGFSWHLAGENLAAGRQLPAEALAQWLGSVGHCHGLMDGRYTASGIAYAYSTSSEYRHFWAQNFAS